MINSRTENCGKSCCKPAIPQAFTLIELLVVIAIIALLVSILLPSLNTARDLAKQVVCLTNLKGMGTAMGMYRSSYDGDNPFLLVSGVSGNNAHIRWAAQLVKEGMLDKSGGVLQCPYSEYKGLSPYSAAGRAQDDGEAYPYCTYIANGGIFPSNSTYMQSLMVPENMANATNTVHIQCCAIDKLKPQRDAWMAGMTYYFGFHGAVHDEKALTLFGDSHAQPLDGIEISPNSSTAIYGMYDQIDGMAFNYNR